MINVHDEEFSKIAQDIKERFLGQVAFPKLIIGTGLSLMYDLPGMAALANRLNDFISQELALKDEWEKIYEYVYHRKKMCYTTEYQSGRRLKEQFREDKKKKER